MTNEEAIKLFNERNAIAYFVSPDTLYVEAEGQGVRVELDDLTAHDFITKYITPAIEELTRGTIEAE